jgi:hypothetical protein
VAAVPSGLSFTPLIIIIIIITPSCTVLLKKTGINSSLGFEQKVIASPL